MTDLKELPICPPTIGGFWYIKRQDGAILMRNEDEYMQFDSKQEAGLFAETLDMKDLEVRWMPRMVLN